MFIYTDYIATCRAII